MKNIKLKLKHLGEVTIKPLTVGDMLGFSKIPEEKQMLHMVSKALLDPKMSVKDLENLDFKYLEDLSLIVEKLTNIEE